MGDLEAKVAALDGDLTRLRVSLKVGQSSGVRG